MARISPTNKSPGRPSGREKMRTLRAMRGKCSSVSDRDAYYIQCRVAIVRGEKNGQKFSPRVTGLMLLPGENAFLSRGSRPRLTFNISAGSEESGEIIIDASFHFDAGR